MYLVRWMIFLITAHQNYFPKPIRLFRDDAVFSANLKVGQLGLYLQDEVNINPRFKLTYGLRIDRPIYPEAPLENPAITAMSFYAKDGSLTHYNGGKWLTP